MADILKDKTHKALISMSLPISIGMLSTFLFQVIDTYFVGQLGAESLAALSFSSTIYFLLISIFIGLSVGVSIIIGKSAGEKDAEKIKKTTLIAIIVSLVLSIALVSLVLLFVEDIFQGLGADDKTIPYITAYMIPLLLGVPLLNTSLLCGGILRATGNIVKPEALMGVAGVLNLVFDYLLIFGKWGFPELGIKGAAYATVLSWIFLIVGMLFLLVQDRLLSFSLKAKTSTKLIIAEIFKLGAPTILTQVIIPLTLIFLTFLLAKQSFTAVAAFGVAGRIEVLLMIGIFGVSSSITPFIAQNSGAEKPERIDEAIVFGGRASTFLGLFVALLLFCFIKPIATIFSDHEEVIGYTVTYFHLVGLSYIFYGLFLVTTSIFSGLQLPINSLKISAVKLLLFTMPLTLIGSIWGVGGIFTGFALSNVLAGIYAANQIQKELKRTNSALADVTLLQAYKNDIMLLFGKR